MDRKHLENLIAGYQHSPEEDQYIKHLEDKHIVDYDQLNQYIDDSRNQFFGNLNVKQDFENKEYLYLEDYFRQQGISIDDLFLKDSNVRAIISEYNKLVDEARKFTSKEEAVSLFSKVEKFAKDNSKNFYTNIFKHERFLLVFNKFFEQFGDLDEDFIEGLDFKKIKERNKGRVYKKFQDLLVEKQKVLYNKFKITEPYMTLIKDFDYMVEKASNLNSEEDLKEFVDKFNKCFNVK